MTPPTDKKAAKAEPKPSQAPESNPRKPTPKAEPQGDKPAKVAGWTPKVGGQVLFTRIHNGPRVVRSLALITGVRSEFCLDLLVCPAGAAPFAEPEAPRGGKPGDANTWGPPE